MARPRKKVDPAEVRKLAALGCTQDEIGVYLGVDQATISRRFASEYALGVGECKISLRRLQWKSAQRSVPMQIHLGKQHLGQSDKVQQDGTTKILVEFDDDGDGPPHPAPPPAPGAGGDPPGHEAI